MWGISTGESLRTEVETQIGFSEGFSDGIGYVKIEGAGSEYGPELGFSDETPSGNNDGKLERYLLVHSLGTGSGTVVGSSDVIPSNRFSGGDGYIKLEGS